MNVFIKNKVDLPLNSLHSNDVFERYGQTLNDALTHNKQGSKDALVRIVVLLTLSLIKSHKYYDAVLLAALCVKSKI